MRVKTAYQAFLDSKDMQVSVIDQRFSSLYRSLYARIGDAGEPGLHGGYSQPGHKGESGMLAQLAEIHEEMTRLILGEPGEVGLPGMKGPPGDSGLCMYWRDAG